MRTKAPLRHCIGFCLIYAVLGQSVLTAQALPPTGCDALLQSHAGGKRIIELRLHNGEKPRGRLLNVTETAVVLENKKDKSTRDIKCSQIDDYRLKGGKPIHWVQWTVMGVVVVAGAIGLAVLAISQMDPARK